MLLLTQFYVDAGQCYKMKLWLILFWDDMVGEDWLELYHIQPRQSLRSLQQQIVLRFVLLFQIQLVLAEKVQNLVFLSIRNQAKELHSTHNLKKHLLIDREIVQKVTCNSQQVEHTRNLTQS